MIKKLLSLTAIAALVVGVVPSLSTSAAVAQQKVEICHRDNNVKKPYGPKRIEVAASAADGDTTNDNGQGDHSEHTGPVATSEAYAQSLKDNKQNWGDIIPPNGNYPGLNWTAEGQAIYNNNCQYVQGGQGGGTTTTTTTVASSTPASTPQVKVTPTSSVPAGAGGGSDNTTSVVALLASLGALGYGALRLRKYNV